MKVCKACNVEMLPAKLHGEPFSIDMDKEIDDFSIRYVNGTTEVKGLFGKTKHKDNLCESELKARVCPNCGKVELYIDINK